MKDSQFPDTEFGNALKGMVGRSRLFYREYVTQDHGHVQIAEITKEEALAKIKKSDAYRVGVLKEGYMVFHSHLTGELTDMGNKGAIRMDDFSDDTQQVWVYKADSWFYLTRPRGEDQ